MRKIISFMHISLDGFVAGPNGEMDWMTMPWTDDVNSYVQGIIDSIDTIVLGRKLSEGFIPYWASVAADASNPEVESGKTFTNLPKVVFTQTLEKNEWENTVLASDLVEEIAKLKSQEGKDIYACGGATFVSSLIKHGLIDEYHLFINLKKSGKGMAIFTELDSKQSLQLIKSTAFDCGIVALHYEPKRN